MKMLVGFCKQFQNWTENQAGRNFTHLLPRRWMQSRRQDERTDLWIVRNNHMMPYLYWGFEQLSDEEVVDVLRRTGAVLFLSDFPQLTKDINHTAEAAVTTFVRSWFSTASDEKLHQVPPLRALRKSKP